MDLTALVLVVLSYAIMSGSRVGSEERAAAVLRPRRR